MFDLLMIALLQAVAGEPSAATQPAEQSAAAPATTPAPEQAAASDQPQPRMRRQRVCQEIEVTGNRIPQRVCQYVMVEEEPAQQAPPPQGE